jgi:uncharacterized protein YfaS (alpha-2-macroglobulin family)
MTKRTVSLSAIVPAVFAFLFLAIRPVAAGEPLRVLSSGPSGEIERTEQAREIRIVFSEPMVPLGASSEMPAVPFVRIAPPLAGAFRWSGTRTLVFTPDAASPLPRSTRYEVAVDGSATALSGRKLGAPHLFSFTTPTLRIVSAKWSREKGTVDSAIRIELLFNQPVEPEAVAGHLRVHYVPHEWKPPLLSLSGKAWLRLNDPASLADFDRKVAKTLEITRADFPLPTSLDRTGRPSGATWRADRLLLRSNYAPLPDAKLRITLLPTTPAVEGTARPAAPTSTEIALEPTLFVDDFRCLAECDPDGHNPLRLRSRVKRNDFRKALAVSDVTDPAKEQSMRAKPAPAKGSDEEENEWGWDDSWFRTLDEAGFELAPARSYRVRIDRSLRSADGQLLGYSWASTLRNGHRSAFSSFGDGHGVWETSSGTQLPFSARNVTRVTQRLLPIAEPDLMKSIRRFEDGRYQLFPGVPGHHRSLSSPPDEIRSFGFDISPALSPGGFGIFWASVKNEENRPGTRRAWDEEGIATSLVQVTDLGITVKDSPDGSLVWVTRLSNGEPVAGARVRIRSFDRLLWEGSTDVAGLARPPALPLRDREEGVWKLTFVVTAEKEGDLAYVGSDWTSGTDPWEFGLTYDLEEATPLLRGSVFTDRGVYRLGEEIRFKAILRSDTPHGIRLFPAGTKVEITLTDPRDRKVDERTITLSPWSSADWSWSVPEEASLGNWRLEAKVAGQNRTVRSEILVAAYRKPDFRVDARLEAAATPVAGAPLSGSLDARYLFGGAMAGRPVRWTFSGTPSFALPSPLLDRFPAERWQFLDHEESAERDDSRERITEKEATLSKEGTLRVDLPTPVAAGRPIQYQFEGEVTDASRQKIAGRASLVVHPAPWYVGIRNLPFFGDTAKGIETEVVAVGLDGVPVAGVPLTATLTEVQWISVRRAEGDGFYGWESERKEIPAGRIELVSRGEPIPLRMPIAKGGYHLLRIEAKDAAGHGTRSAAGFYALGEGYTAWQRYDHNRIDLVPEKKRWKPGDTARILVKSPWEKANAIVTTEREGVRSVRPFTLSGTQETLSIPIGEEDIPNLYVSVVLVKGRSREPGGDADTSDPGKPSYRVGYCELEVEDRTKRLDVRVASDREEYRPGSKGSVDVEVVDSTGRPADTEVTLWAVDHGVLSLTAWQPPDVVESIYMPKAIQVLTEDSRRQIVSRRVITPKGADDGGGGGREGGAARKDFRVLAFWLGSLETGADGKVRAEVSLPESMTTYRIVALAGDRGSRFGWGQREIRVSKPLLLLSAFPRFLSVGDRARFGSVVHGQGTISGSATVSVESLDPALLEVRGAPRTDVPLEAGGSAEALFDFAAKRSGKARLRFTVSLGGESDSFEDSIPIRNLAFPETVATSGTAKPEATESVVLPREAVPTEGGLELSFASTSLVGLEEGARYLVEYPYGCAEQRTSSAFALLLAAELGESLHVPGLDPKELKPQAVRTLERLSRFQCEDGGFSTWGGACSTGSPYLTSWILHALGRAGKMGVAVDRQMLEDATGFLDRWLNRAENGTGSSWVGELAARAFAAKVLVEAGKNEDSPIARLYGDLDRMPLFAVAWLDDALAAKGEPGTRRRELRRRILNSILPEGSSSHVEERQEPELLWLWSSNERSTAIVLSNLVRSISPGDPLEGTVRGLVRWLLDVRRNGRWGNTQENAWALEALVDVHRKLETEVPDFSAIASLGGEVLARAGFHGRSAKAIQASVPMPKLVEGRAAGEPLPLGFRLEGTGTLHWSARMRWTPSAPDLPPLDRGFLVERSYEPMDGRRGDSRAFRAGELVRVTLRFRLPKERRFVAVVDPLPAGFEPVDSLFKTTASDLAREAQGDGEEGDDWTASWRRGGFDHVERLDDRVRLFATRLSEGEHLFTYVVRATTAGEFRAAPARAEEMYESEVFGRSGTDRIEVRP